MGAEDKDLEKRVRTLETVANVMLDIMARDRELMNTISFYNFVAIAMALAAMVMGVTM